MLRTLFVLAIAAFGMRHAVRGPFYALLLYLWVAYFRPEFWVWGGFAASLPLSFVTGLFLVGSTIFSSEARLKFNVTNALLFVLLGHSLISTMLSQHSEYAWPYWTDFAKSTIITYLIACLITDGRKFRLTLIVIVASLSFEVTKQGWAELVRNPGEKNHNFHPFLGDENGVALGVLMLIPLLTALARTSQLKSEKATYAFLTVGALYRALSTYSRGGFLSAGVLLALHLARSRRRLRGMLVVALLVGIFVPLMPQSYWDRMNTIAFSEERLNQEDDSSRGRFHFWRVAVTMANANPVFGVGHNAFNPSYDAYDFLDARYGTERAVHSTWFGLLAELGYPGFVLFVLILLLAFRSASRVRRAAARDKLPSELGIYATALESSILVFVVGGTLLSAQYLEMLWHIIGLSAALRGIADQAATQSQTQPAVALAGSVARPMPCAHAAVSRGRTATVSGT